MQRRTFLSLAASILATVSPLFSLARRVKPLIPLVEIDWMILHDDVDCIGWGAIKSLAMCDCCYEGPTTDFGNGLSEPRKFYGLQDGTGLIVCEHCAPEFVAENPDVAMPGVRS